MAILLSALSALLFGTADFTGGYASRKNPIPAVLVWSQLAGLALVLLFSLLDRAAVAPGVTDVVFGAAAGAAGLGGLALLYRGLSRGYVAIVSPLAAVLGAVVPLAAGLVFGERLSVTAAVGIGLSLPAIILISWHGHLPVESRNPRRIRESWRDGVLSGLFFGLFFVFISRTSPESGMWPLAVARLTSIGMMAMGVVSTRRAFRLHGGWPTVVLAGVLDMAANIALVLAIRQGLLTIVTVIASAYPAQTVLLSRIFFGERIGAVRMTGIALALAGIALMSL